LHFGDAGPRGKLGDRQGGLGNVGGLERLCERFGGGLHRAILQNFGIDEARADHASADVVLLLFDADRVRKAHQAAFGRLVGRAGNVGGQAGNRRYVNEVTGFALAHGGQHG